jgi:DNA uptake protein ComE-like DNA-binding protein
MKRRLLFTLSLILLTAAGCKSANENPTPEQIRQDTAKATKAAAQDAKAVVEGVKDGLKSKTPGTGGAININTASPDDLKTLPGIDDTRAQRIIANRPYDHSDDLVAKHVVSRDEYDRISSQIVAQ